MGEIIESFEDLRVYQKSCDLDLMVFHETFNWPRDEKFALIDQVRRSSRSIGANLAEAWAKRRYRAHFVSKLTDADGELQETLHWLNRAFKYGYLSRDEYENQRGVVRETGNMLGKMISEPDSFIIGKGKHDST